VREEVRTTNNQHPMTTKVSGGLPLRFWYDLHRGMCWKPSGKVQEGREGLLMGNICDW